MSTLVYWLWKAQHHLIKAPLCGLSTKLGFSWRCTECRYWADIEKPNEIGRFK